MLEVLYHHAKFGGARISPAAVTATNVEFLFVCLSVCRFSRVELKYNLTEPGQNWGQSVLMLFGLYCWRSVMCELSPFVRSWETPW